MGTLTFIIIIGIISSIFGKVRAKNPNSRDKPFSINNVDDLRGLFTNRTSKQQVEYPPAFTIENIQKKYQRVKKEKVVEQLDVVLEDVLKAEEVQSPVKVTIDRPAAPSEPDKIINGIIWSEILAEPRARKPYFTRRR